MEPKSTLYVSDRRAWRKWLEKNHKIRCFYFMFSTLLYNLWVITNAMLSQYLFGEQVEYRLITAKMFMKKFYEAYKTGIP